MFGARVVTVAAMALTASCFNPSYNSPTCGSGGACPAALVCDLPSQLCVSAGGGGDAAISDAHAIADAASTRTIAHVPLDHQQPGTADLALNAGTIHTDTLTLPTGNVVGGGIVFEHVAQTPSGPQLAVLHVRALTIADGVSVQAIGSAPLVIIAETITISGTLDVGSYDTVVGAGGSAPGAGSGSSAGGSGSADVGGTGDGGGGGGGFGTAGGSGGVVDTGSCPVAEVAGALGGAITGTSTLDVLEGGGGGGAGSPGGCTVSLGGAGGGAVQLSAIGTLTISHDGIVGASGGGGTGGVSCATESAGAGGGGGAGGAIVLDAATVIQNGLLIASGGGGGGGACSPGGSAGAGSDGGTITTVPAGGSGHATCGADGGSGALATAPAGLGTSEACGGNSGAGGGGVGRIAYYVPHGADVTGSGTSSPSAFVRLDP